MVDESVQKASDSLRIEVVGSEKRQELVEKVPLLHGQEWKRLRQKDDLMESGEPDQHVIEGPVQVGESTSMVSRSFISIAAVATVLASCGKTWTCECYSPNHESEYEVAADSGEQALEEAEKRCFDDQKDSYLMSAPVLIDTPAGQVEKPSTPISMAEPCKCSCRSGFSKVYSD